MADGSLRRLEQRWHAGGTVEDFVLYQAERLRVGELTPEPTERLSGAALALEAAYHELGGVLEFSQVDCGLHPSEEEHRQAVLTTFKRLVDENVRSIQENSARLGYAADAFFRLRIDRERFAGRSVTLREFLGWQYDAERDCLALKGSSPEHLNGRFLAPYEETAECLCDYSTLAHQWDPELDLEEACGFAHAFSDPPYGMRRAGSRTTNTLFRALCQVLFGGLSPELKVVRWETDWTNYFEAGREWWGEYLWTVNRPGTRAIVVIAGSATD